MASVEVVRPDRVLVEGYIVRNKYWFGIVKCSEGKRLVEGCCLI